MSKCIQTGTQSVLEHGESVWRYTQKILDREWNELRIPNWLSENYNEIVSNLHDRRLIQEYNVLHDCGKPYCLEIDEEGKRHFPNHAEVSKQTYLNLPGANKIVADLIGWDMVFHTATAEEIKSLNFSKRDSYTLLITALAELHSNAEMFGGIESVSFKSKWKKIDRRGNMILKGGEQ
jgi:hypothetical protein